jgi:hypothetical protein
MTANGWWGLVAAALVLGLATGGWAAFRVAQTRLAKRVRRITEELQQRHAATMDQLRAAQVRTQTELEQTRSTFKRQLAASTEEPRAAVARAEERLKAAYAELDRLRAKGVAPTDSGPSDLQDGFAATRPMRESM